MGPTRLRALLVMLLLIAASTGNAETWTSPDGFLSIEAPDEAESQAVPSPPAPFLGLWVSNDETVKLGVMKVEIPANLKLNQSKAEEGLSEEIGGEVTRLPTTKVSGYEVWKMRGKGPAGEITQALVRNGNSAYKLMAMTLPGEGNTEAVDRFFNSLVLNRPAEPPKQQPSETKTAQPRDEAIDTQALSKMIGGTAAVLGIGLLAYYWSRKRKR